jgi:hypothetical protein
MERVMQIEGIPSFAERVDLMSVYRTVKRPSKFAPPCEALVSKLECPACHTMHEDPGSLRTLVCNCGLHLQAAAGAVYIWRLPEAAAVE